MMRIERIRTTKLTGLGDVDLTFPIGSVLLFSEDINRQKLLCRLFLEFFYDLKKPPLSNEQSYIGLVEVWIAGDNRRFHIARNFIRQDHELGVASDLMIEDASGQKVLLQDKMALGEFLFQVSLQTFLQGGFITWPASDEPAYFSRGIRNMQLSGEEGLSLVRVRASISGAQKRVKEQTESMQQVKAEYDTLRGQWEEAHRRQEKERLLLIEIKNLQEKERILAEKISCAAKTQERLEVLRQNPDYRELRQLQETLTRLEERLQELESDLILLTRETQVDWTIIEGLREDCAEWAWLEEKVSQRAAEIQKLVQIIKERQDFLQTSGYQGLADNEVHRLGKAEEERVSALEELEREQGNLAALKSKSTELQKIYLKEAAKLKDLSVMADVTEACESKMAQQVKQAEQWHSSKIGNFLDKVMQEQLGVKSIGERFVRRLTKNCENYQASNYEEFKGKLKKFRAQQKLVAGLREELEQVHSKLRWEEKLFKIVNSRSQILRQAFNKVKAADFPAWQKGWEDYQRSKHQLTLWQEKLQVELPELKKEENEMAASAAQLREKLGNWGIEATDRDEVLAVVLQVARKQRAKDEVGKDVILFSQKFQDQLSGRNMENLAKTLEPLAELERERHLFNEEKLEETAEWHKEQAIIHQRLQDAEQRLQANRNATPLSALEKKIETVKRQWLAYEGLKSALDSIQVLLENSWQEWNNDYGKALKKEKKWIFSQISASGNKRRNAGEGIERKLDYFAYRLAIAQLALGENPDIPLFFSVGKLGAGQSLGGEIFTYLRHLSHSRQIIVVISDDKSWKEAASSGWPNLAI